MDQFASICRLCGSEKSAQNLVISLDEKIQDITFKEFVEFYCQVTLDKSLYLPQKVCRDCKVQVVNFSEFSFIVEERQKLFDVKPKLVESSEKLVEVKRQKLDDLTTSETHEVDTKPSGLQSIESILASDKVNQFRHRLQQKF